MKTCNRCERELDDSQFNLKRGKLQPFCKSCQSVYHKYWYNKNKEKRKLQIYKRSALELEKIKEKIKQIKSAPCKDCGQVFNYWQMDFDHITDKHFCISSGVSSRKSWKSLEKEIAKCELVCSNCHRNRTHFRQTDS